MKKLFSLLLPTLVAGLLLGGSWWQLNSPTGVRAAQAVTGPVTSINYAPEFLTTSLPNGTIGEYYRGVIRVIDRNEQDSLSMKVPKINLPEGLRYDREGCKTELIWQDGTKLLTCVIKGVPTTAGSYDIRAVATDGQTNSVQWFSIIIDDASPSAQVAE